MKKLCLTIRKPLYGNYCSVRESVLKEAIRGGGMLEITVPNGVGVVDPAEWMRTGKLKLQNFKYKEPLRLWYNTVPVPVKEEKKEEPKKEEEIEKQSSLF